MGGLPAARRVPQGAGWTYGAGLWALQVGRSAGVGGGEGGDEGGWGGRRGRNGLRTQAGVGRGRRRLGVKVAVVGVGVSGGAGMWGVRAAGTR